MRAAIDRASFWEGLDAIAAANQGGPARTAPADQTSPASTTWLRELPARFRAIRARERAQKDQLLKYVPEAVTSLAAQQNPPLVLSKEDAQRISARVRILMERTKAIAWGQGPSHQLYDEVDETNPSDDKYAYAYPDGMRWKELRTENSISCAFGDGGTSSGDDQEVESTTDGRRKKKRNRDASPFRFPGFDKDRSFDPDQREDPSYDPGSGGIGVA